MELQELQTLWQQYDVKLTANTQINKEILRRIIRKKPERKIKWSKMYHATGLFLMPVLLLIIFTIRPLISRHELGFYIGIFLFFGGCFMGWIWSFKNYLLLRRIDLTNMIIISRRDIISLEKFRTRVLQSGYILSPFVILGVFMMSGVRFSPQQTFFSILPLILCFLVMLTSMYFQFKWKNEWFKKINSELDELEELEKE